MAALAETIVPDHRTHSEFHAFTVGLAGLPVAHLWRGYGSAIFLEIGSLHPGHSRSDGTPGNPIGDWTLAIEWSWRIEGKRRFWCGSWSSESRWPRAFARIVGSRVVSASLLGRIPEIDIELTNGLHVLSMMTAEGNPQWSLTRQQGQAAESIFIRSGRLIIQNLV